MNTPQSVHASSARDVQHHSPGSPPDWVLLAVTGMSPAILTETVWALAHESTPIIPSRIIVVTTAQGRRRLVDQLLTPSAACSGLTPWDALRSSLAALGHDLTGRLRFGATADDVHVITAFDPNTGQSRELNDIRSPAENDAAADFILERVRAIVENPDTLLVASIAGGRKTMGALLYACMTLLGRETDRLTHVLVNEPFDSLQGFWFPGQPGQLLVNGSAPAPLPASAIVELADVPFIPLRNLFRRELGRPAGTFRRLVELGRTNVRISTGEGIRLEIDRAHTVAHINHSPLHLAIREHLVLLYFAERAKGRPSQARGIKELIDDLEAFRQELISTAPATNGADWRHEVADLAPLQERDVTRVLSDIRRKARQASNDATLLAGVLPERGRPTLDIPGPMIFLKG